MPFTEEIKQAAETLGKLLAADPSVREFVSLKKDIQQDPSVAGLELKLADLYQKLADRQQNGEVLERAELEEYYSLKQQFHLHPLIAARDGQLEFVKAIFVETAKKMTSVLGAEYTTFAK
jgi:cell fate (sporulation/competence/biofilm development) regulator YlbF (YheA/YmcA/DUF963 family)